MIFLACHLRRVKYVKEVPFDGHGFVFGLSFQAQPDGVVASST